MPTLSTKKKLEFSRLSWKLLEAKILYYLYPEMDNISDAEYDKLEKEYLGYCDKYKLENSIQSMVGVDQERHSVQCAIRKILSGESSKSLLSS